MENQNNNKVVIALLVVIIAILVVLCVLFATGTISFKNQNVETNSNNNTSSTTENNVQTNDNEYDAVAIAKEKMPTIVSLVNQGEGVYNYCGDIGSDYITINNMRYVSSKEYVTLNSLQDYLHHTITKDLFDKYFDAAGYAVENGKLYCKNLPTDGLYTHYVTEDSINSLDNLNYQISNKTDNSFDVVMSFDYYSQVDDQNNGKHTFYASFIKENNEWLIKSFSE